MSEKEIDRDFVEVSTGTMHTYNVEVAYFLEDKFNEVHMSIGNMFKKRKILVSRYELQETSLQNAINRALTIDMARKTEVMMKYPMVLHDFVMDKGEEFDIEILDDFREWLTHEGLLQEYMMQQPTSVQAFIKQNEPLLRRQTEEAVNEKIGGISDEIAEFLKEHAQEEE